MGERGERKKKFDPLAFVDVLAPIIKIKCEAKTFKI